MARYQKLPKSGKHYFRQGGKRICVRPGEIVEAEADELGSTISTYKCLDPQPPKPSEPEPTQRLFAKHAGGGRYNVINEATGKRINDVTLSKEEAQSLADKGLDEEDDASSGDGQAGGGDTDNGD